MNPIDTALAAVAAAETAFNADTANVTGIQSNIVSVTAAAQTSVANATAPLAPALAQQVADTATYVQTLNSASAAFLAAAQALTPVTAS